MPRSISPITRPLLQARHGLRFCHGLAILAGAALSALVLIVQPLPVLAVDGAASQPAGTASAPVSHSIIPTGLLWPIGDWKGIREVAGKRAVVMLRLRGTQESELIFEGLKCRVALIPQEFTPEAITYSITGKKGGAPGMAPACDRLWGSRLKLSAKESGVVVANIPELETEPEVVLQPAEVPADTRCR